MRLERMRVSPSYTTEGPSGKLHYVNRTDGLIRGEVPEGHFGESYWFWCDPCKTHHVFRTKLSKDSKGRVDEDHPVWTFNGDMASPTFSPSLLYFDPEHVVDGKTIPRKTNCHLHLRNGVIEYCADCPHPMAGKSVPLPVMP